jgi:antitoxin YefM
MPIQTTYTNARANFAKFCDEVTANREIVIINRRGYEDVALIAASELSSLAETAHLLRSPKNAERLLTALKRAKARTVKPQTMEKLRREVGLG